MADSPSLRTLSDLPNELLEAVCERLVTARDISALTRTCGAAYQALISRLYLFDHENSHGYAIEWAIRNNCPKTIAQSINLGLDVVTLRHICLVAAEGHDDIFDTLWAYKNTFGRFKSLVVDDEATRPFNIAVATGSLHMARTMLAAHEIDVDQTNELGHTPLSDAAHNGDLAMVNLILQHGADVNAPCHDYRRPLGVAAVPHPHSRCQRLHVRPRIGFRPDFPGTLRALINHGAEIENKEPNGMTPLHQAAKTGDGQMVLLLALYGANVNTTDIQGRTPLHTANLHLGDLKMAKLLVRLNSNVNKLSKDGRNPLWISHKTKDKKALIKLLLDSGAEIVTDTIGNTPLHYTAALRCAAAVEVLLDHGANINATNKEGTTSLHYAAGVDHNDETIKLLIDRGADVLAKKKGGETALTLALATQPAEIIELLLRNGANPNVLSRNRSSLLHQITMNGNKTLARLLLHHGADPNQVDASGMTPLFRAVKDGNVYFMELLVKSGAEINARDNYGRTPLVYALAVDAIKGAEWLITHGADVNTMDIMGEPVLHRACQFERRREIARLLLRHGVNVNATNSELRCTALHVAAEEGEVGIIEQLLLQGADLNAVDKEGRTPIMYAILGSEADVFLRMWKSPRITLTYGQ